MPQNEAKPEYRVVLDTDLFKLVTEVEQNLQRGFIPVGGITQVMGQTSRFNEPVPFFAQALYKPLLERVN